MKLDPTGGPKLSSTITTAIAINRPLRASGGFSGTTNSTGLFSPSQIPGIGDISSNLQTGDLTDLQHARTGSGLNLVEETSSQGTSEVGLSPSLTPGKTESRTGSSFMLELLEEIQMKTEQSEEGEERSPQPELQPTVKEEQLEFSESDAGSSFWLDLLENIKTEEPEGGEESILPEIVDRDVAEGANNVHLSPPEEKEEGEEETGYSTVVMRDHDYTLPHCTYCNKTFRRRSNLKIHVMTVHLRERSHPCPHCNKTFGLSINLKTHVKTVHFGERSPACPHCNKTFSQSSGLKRHVNAVHLGERSHPCPHCNKTFSSSSYLKEHVKALHLGM